MFNSSLYGPENLCVRKTWQNGKRENANVRRGKSVIWVAKDELLPQESVGMQASAEKNERVCYERHFVNRSWFRIIRGSSSRGQSSLTSAIARPPSGWHCSAGIHPTTATWCRTTFILPFSRLQVSTFYLSILQGGAITPGHTLRA